MVKCWIESMSRKKDIDQLGSVLWSPQKSTNDADFYRQMRNIKPDDVVLHLINNEIVGVSKAASKYNDNFVCPSGPWEGRPGYEVRLKDFIDFRKNRVTLNRNEFLNQKNNDKLIKIHDEWPYGIGKLFYTKNLTLTQGAYLTYVSNELAALIDKEYRAKYGNGIPYLDGLDEKNDLNYGDEKMTSENNVESFIDYLKREGFLFDVEVIENFLLSLKVKPFVILTGGSGTGKTKIAQLYAQYISDPTQPVIETPRVIRTVVTIGKSGKNNGWSLSGEDCKNVFPEMFEKEGTYSIKVNGMPGKGNLDVTPRLFLAPESKDIKSYLLDGDPDTKIPLEIEVASGERPRHQFGDRSQYKIVPVGANWTESRHLLGFHNMITSQYHSAPAMDLLLMASKDQKRPYMLILDEMNLSHVERYFSDFLSCIESGEPIPHQYASDGKISTLSIPENFFIVGTVNVDETTYMFSPKVLDRANTIEFDNASVNKYVEKHNSEQKYSGNQEYLEKIMLGSGVRGKKASELFQEIFGNSESGKEVLGILESMRLALEPINQSFGFRVVDEIMRFMYVAWEYRGKKQKWNWERYLDAQIKQKILPKLHGNHLLSDPLRQLFKICTGTDIENFDQNYANVRFPNSAKKIMKMWNALRTQRYASFVC